MDPGTSTSLMRASNRIGKINSSGIFKAVAASVSPAGFCGDDGPALAARLSAPRGITIDRRGSSCISADSKQSPHPRDRSGWNDPHGCRNGHRRPAPAIMDRPRPRNWRSRMRLLLRNGNLFLADFSNSKVRQSPADGVISTLVAPPRVFLRMTPDLSNPYPVSCRPTATRFSLPMSSNNRSALVGGSSRHHAGGRRRRWESSGIGVLEFTVSDRRRRRRRHLMWAGHGQPSHNARSAPTAPITTVAGNGRPASAATEVRPQMLSLRHLAGVAVDGAGNVYLSDTTNQSGPQSVHSGNHSTVAGSGLFGFSGDGTGVANQTRGPGGLCFGAER